MINSGYIVYVLLVIILWAFWKRVRRQTLGQLLHKSALEHHQVSEFHKACPQGRIWSEYKQWMAQHDLHNKS